MVKGADIYFLGLLCSFFALLCSFFTVEIFTGLVRLDLFPSAFRFGLNWLIKEMANIFKERFSFFFLFLQLNFAYSHSVCPSVQITLERNPERKLYGLTDTDVWGTDVMYLPVKQGGFIPPRD